MATIQSKVTSKGQITLPKQIRTRLAIYPGDRLEFSLENANTVSIRKKRRPGASAGCGKRFLKQGTQPISADTMKAGIKNAMLRKFDRPKPARI